MLANLWAGPYVPLGGDLVGEDAWYYWGREDWDGYGYAVEGWCMKVLYTTHSNKNAVLEEMLGAKRVDLETLLKESDFISIHTPLSEKTKHLIGAKELSLMKKTAYLYQYGTWFSN